MPPANRYDANRALGVTDRQFSSREPRHQDQMAEDAEWWFGCHYGLEEQTKGSNAYDCDFKLPDGLHLEVKWTEYDNGALIRPDIPENGRAGHVCDLYVLVVGKTKYDFRMAGWHLGSVLHEERNYYLPGSAKEVKPGSPPAWMLRQDALFKTDLSWFLRQHGAVHDRDVFKYGVQWPDDYPESATNPQAGEQVETSNPTEHLPTLHPHRRQQ